jgi:amino acid permease
MMKAQIGLGVLSIPAVFDTLGYIPGVLSIIAIAAITTWSDYIIGIFKLRHPSVYSLDDVGALMFGPLGRYFFAAAFVICKHLPDILEMFCSLTNVS